jgi:hypothetical protein
MIDENERLRWKWENVDRVNDKSTKKDKALDTLLHAFMDTNCSMLAFSKMSAL